MLVPATLVADKLAEAWKRKLLEPGGLEWMRWYRASPGSTWAFEVLGPSDWDHIARASMRGDEVLGYVDATVDRQCNTVYQMAVWAVRRGSRGFLRDLEEFADGLLEEYRCVRFVIGEGSPSRPVAESWVKRRDGRVVGTMTAWGRDYKGRIWDAVMYEVPGRGHGA